MRNYLLPLLTTFVLLASGCYRQSSDSIVREVQEQISQDIPTGTTMGVVEEYFGKRNLAYTFEDDAYLRESGTLNLHPEDLRDAGSDLQGRYCVLVRKVGLGNNAISVHAYVYVNRSNRVSAIRCRSFHTGP